jgi:hypothetical protein
MVWVRGGKPGSTGTRLTVELFRGPPPTSRLLKSVAGVLPIGPGILNIPFCAGAQTTHLDEGHYTRWALLKNIHYVVYVAGYLDQPKGLGPEACLWFWGGGRLFGHVGDFQRGELRQCGQSKLLEKLECRSIDDRPPGLF